MATPDVLTERVYIKLFECSPEFCDIFSSIFSKAKEAIENGDLRELKVQVRRLNNCQKDKIEHLDVCEVLQDERCPTTLVECAGIYSSPKEGENRSYYMTLLAYAGYHGRIDMINHLISEGANVDDRTDECGTPLLQMFLYARIQKEKLELPKINIGIVKLFIERGAQLDCVISPARFTILTLAIAYQCIDIAKLVIEKQLETLFAGDGEVFPIFVEYHLFKTHNILKWLLEEHLRDIPGFIHCLLDEEVFFKQRLIDNNNPAHGFLLCGRKLDDEDVASEVAEKAICCLVEENKRRQHDQKILKDVVDGYGKTALHIAAVEGDLSSVNILKKCCSDESDVINAVDSSSMTPLMRATMRKHTEVVEALQPSAVKTSAKRDKSDIKRELYWALHNGYHTYFEAMHGTEEGEECLLTEIDEVRNTIAHLAVEKGRVLVFKATFPRTHHTFDDGQMLQILTKENKSNKTPFQIAIEKGNIDMLNAFQERRFEREKQYKRPNVASVQGKMYEYNEMKRFWNKKSPGLLLYACLHGTVEIVDYFVSKLVKANKTSIAGHTALCCAARAGKSGIMTYLFSRGVPTQGYTGERKLVPDKYSPLMLASKFGHADCVTLLLKKGASVDVKSDRDYNCLMEAIKGGHKDTAAALMKSEKWEDLMHCRVKKSKKVFINPLMMLIKEMPDVAKIVFTRSISHDESGFLVHDYSLLEDYSPAQTDGEAPAQTDGEAPAQTDGEAPADTQTLSNVTSGSVIATTSFIEDQDEVTATDHPATLQESGIPATPTGPDKTPWWLEYKDNRECEDQDDLPSHPLTLMVQHRRLELLQHPLISQYISIKWWKLSPLFFGYLLLYIIFLALLTTFSIYTPRPGPDDEYCPGNGTRFFTSNFTDDKCEEPDVTDKRAFTALAVIIILLSLVFFVFHVVVPIINLMLKPSKHFTVQWMIETTLRAITFILTIIFVFGFVNDCWCAPPWQWQIGALAVFMAYINFMLLLKGMPWLGIYINMLLKIVIEFMKLILVPFLLILSFAFPFYMLFVRDAAGEQSVGVLEAFSSPAQSIAKTIVQTTGELDFDLIFNHADLLYSPMAYILFLLFTILMPILFVNLLVGLAVGTTKKDLKNATFNKIALQVSYIHAIEAGRKSSWVPGIISRLLHRWCRVPDQTFKENSFLSKLRGVDYQTLNTQCLEEIHKMKEDDKKDHRAMQSDMRAMQSNIKDVKEKLDSLTMRNDGAAGDGAA